VIMGVFAEMTQFLGVRTVLGAFMAGVLVGESPILTRHIQTQLRGMITAFFMPIFFGMSGLAADLTILKDWTLVGFTVLLVAIASVGKFSGAFVGATLGRLSWRESLALGCAMNARGSTEVIVASIGLSTAADDPGPTNDQKLQKENDSAKEPAQQTTGDLTKQEQEYLSALKKCEPMTGGDKQQCVDRTKKQFGHQ